MITLIIEPHFKDYQEHYNECGHYDVILPQKETVILREWCTTKDWASWDVQLYLSEVFNEFFGKNNWVLEFRDFTKLMPLERTLVLKQIDKNNDNIDLDAYYCMRSKYRLPFWSKEPDKFQGRQKMPNFNI